MRLEVCICTHNPNKEIFGLCISSLARQTLDRADFRITIVNNASTIPIDDDIFSTLREGNVSYRVVDEPRLGNLFARITAIKIAEADLITFIDDDIEAPPDFLEESLKLMDENPDAGCIGPRIVLPDYIKMPDWLYPWRGYLAIHDEDNMGMEPIKEFVVDKWKPAEPPSAGATLRKAAVTDFLRYEDSALSGKIGRKGKGTKGLLSCEDALLFRPMHKKGFKASYQPSLFVWHHLNEKRFSFRYCVRLLYGYGMSESYVQFLTGYPMSVVTGLELLKKFKEELFGEWRESDIRRRIMRCAWWFGVHKRTMQLQHEKEYSFN